MWVAMSNTSRPECWPWAVRHHPGGPVNERRSNRIPIANRYPPLRFRLRRVFADRRLGPDFQRTGDQVRKPIAAGGVAIAIVALGVALVGCGSDTKTQSSTSKTTASSSKTTTSNTAAPTSSAQASGPNYTIADYVKENGIVETPIHHGDPGSPTVDLPVPAGWTLVQESQDAPYGGVVYSGAAAPNNPPRITAIFSKLTGNVDPAKILEFAPGELKNLPQYEPVGDQSSSTLGGFNAVQLGGNYMRDGEKRIVGQKTVVIPGQDGLYVLQLNADALDSDALPLMDATNVIDEQTTITP
jgi:hypothetical protein